MNQGHPHACLPGVLDELSLQLCGILPKQDQFSLGSYVQLVVRSWRRHFTRGSHHLWYLSAIIEEFPNEKCFRQIFL